MKRTFVICAGILCLCLSCGEHTASNPETHEQLERLDSAITKVDEYVNGLYTKIDNLKQKQAQATGDEECYIYNKLIADCYMSFVFDSALYYIDKNLALAEKLKRKDWLVEATLAKAKIYSNVGLLEESKEMLNQVSRYPMSDQLRLEYLKQQLYYWSQRSIFYGENNNDITGIERLDEVYAYSDSILARVKDTDSPYYFLGRYWNDRDDGKKRENCDRIKQKLAKMDKKDEWYPQLCGMAAILSDALGEKDVALKYFVEELCVEIRNVSRHLPSLPIVADMACEKGELIYANRFMQAYMKMKDDYADRVRRVTMVSPPMHVYDSTIKQLEADMEGKNHFIYSLMALAIALLLALISSIILFMKQLKLRRKLAASNKQLTDSLKQVMEYQKELQKVYDSLNEKSKMLEDAHHSLLEANYLKEEYIGNLFTVCSGYLEKMSDLKKKIARKVKVKQYEDLQRMATADDTELEAEIKELNKHFDEIFLSIFPNFVEEFNSLLQPDERITVRKGEKLNTDLRIYALVRLGINSSVKIAKILGVSTQTVYNARMKMRTKATASDEELVERVRKLCRIDAMPETEAEEDC